MSAYREITRRFVKYANVDIQVGDWVSFYESGKIVVSPVRYIRKGAGSFDNEFCTDISPVRLIQVLEVRRSDQKSTEDS